MEAPLPVPRRRRARRWLPLALALALAACMAAPSGADEYREDEAGHPLRIVAYVLHPIGVVLDRAIFRPAHWLGHHEPFRTLFGHEDE